MSNYYSRSYVRNGKYVIEQVKEDTYTITPLKGKAVITHVGGNGRFKFMLDGVEYNSEFTPHICQVPFSETHEYYDYSAVEFDRNIKEEWSKLYLYHEDKDSYWKEIDWRSDLVVKINDTLNRSLGNKG